jgi:hypothetical protein
MAMEIKETSQLNGVIKIENKIVAQATATVSSETGTATAYNESINDYDLYVANKVECRSQFDDFQLKVRAKEDEMQTVYGKPVVPEEIPATPIEPALEVPEEDSIL